MTNPTAPTPSDYVVHQGYETAVMGADGTIEDSEYRFTVCGIHNREIDYCFSKFWHKVTCDKCLENQPRLEAGASFSGEGE